MSCVLNVSNAPGLKLCAESLTLSCFKLHGLPRIYTIAGVLHIYCIYKFCGSCTLHIWHPKQTYTIYTFTILHAVSDQAIVILPEFPA